MADMYLASILKMLVVNFSKTLPHYLPNYTEFYLEECRNLHVYVTRQANLIKYIGIYELNVEPLTFTPV
jgi:hypothetical protein